MPQKILRIATRKSPLALWQAEHIRDQLLQYWGTGLEITLLPMLTSGDAFLHDKLTRVGGKGLFVKELEAALLDYRADIAVHSMKDVPAIFPQGLCLGAICKRGNPYDALLSNAYTSLATLPPGATVGTTSLRRQSQLLNLRPDLCIKPLRGNINSRMQKMQHGEYDAIVLAVAGLERMLLHTQIKEIFSQAVMLPASGQGALGIECRTEDKIIQKMLAPLNDQLSALCVHTERQVSAQLGGTCHTPMAIFCNPVARSKLVLQARIASVDGQILISNRQVGSQQAAMRLAHHCVAHLLTQGAAKLLAQVANR